MTRPWLCPGDDTCTAARHDDAFGYHAGCRSGSATEAWRLYYKRGREGRRPPRRLPAVGLARLIRAAQAVGWRTRDIAERSGVQLNQVNRVALGKTGYVTASVNNRLRPTLEDLVHRDGPSAATRTLATTRGWHWIYAWTDVDDPADQPEADPTVTETRDADVAHLDALGHSAARIAARLGIPQRAVERARARLRAAAEEAAA